MKKNNFMLLFASIFAVYSCCHTIYAEDLQKPKSRIDLEEAEDFNEETNYKFDFWGYTFQVSEKWEKEENTSLSSERYYAETGSGTTMFQVLCDSGIKNYEDLYENREEIIKSFGESFDSFKSVDILNYEVADTSAVLFDYDGSVSGIDFIGNMIVFVDDESKNTILISLLNSTEAEYSHFDDFYKIVDSISKRTESANSGEGSDDIPIEYNNALKAAKNYLEYTAFSYNGLVSQLEYEGYSNEACTYAVDNCNADWNEQALNSAINYLEYTAFSYSGLISQLEYEGFTSDQATYGADNCGADWNEQAANAAKNYLEYSSFSRQCFLDQLMYEGFTQEQAEYGGTSAGY